MPLRNWEKRRSVNIPKHESKPARSFRRIEAKYKRAIVIPWLSEGQEWEELRYTLRSIDQHWTDKECPIIIIGDKAPDFFVDGGRLEFIHIKEYDKSREEGLWEAWQIGMQIADDVAWWNDDIYLLKDTGWDDLRIALEEGELTGEDTNLRASINGWRRSMGEGVADLEQRGHTKVMRFATHTPFLFERAKSIEIFETFYLNYKGSWVNLYHNHHQTAHKPCGPEKTRVLPKLNDERYYNHRHYGPDEKTRKVIIEMFPQQAEWENGA